MLDKLKWVLGLFVIAFGAIGYAFKKGGDAKADEISAESLEDKMEYEKAGREAADAGRINEEKVKNEDNKPDTTRYFD